MSKGSKSKLHASVSVDALNSLVEALESSTVEEIVFEKNGEKVKLIRALHPKAPRAKAVTVAAPVAVPAPAAEPVKDILSPGVGIFLRAKDEKSDPFLKLRDAVTVGKTVGMLLFMGIKHEIKSEIDGKLVEMLVEDGQAVEYGQPLLRLK
ncbi:MAG: biotin/lipoyl-containing protein [Spirochaetota bacterium]